MARKRVCQVVLLSIGLLSALSSHAQNNFLGQTVQINTYLNTIIGKPSWLLIVRDVETGQVIPYQFHFKNTENAWIAPTFARAFRVTVSTLQFGSSTFITNFCGLEDGILSRESLFVSLTGTLSPDPRSVQCHVRKYLNYSFPIANAP